MSDKRQGKYTVAFEHPPVIRSSASIVGKKEKEGPLGSYFDTVCEDPMIEKELGGSGGRTSVQGGNTGT